MSALAGLREALFNLSLYARMAWCFIVGHQWGNVHDLREIVDTPETRQLLAEIRQEIGESEYCRRCGMTRGEGG